MHTNYSTKQKDINLPIRYTEKPITAWGGLKLMARWFERINVRPLFGKHLEQLRGGSNRAYDPVEVVLSFVVSVFMGAERLCHTYVLQYDEPVKRLFGFDRVPSLSTFSRFFRRFSRRAVEEVFGGLNNDLIQRMRSFHPTDGVTIDFDSSVFERYGKQEGAVRGYNPRKPGRPSHHPLFALIAEWNWVFHLWLRPGDTVSGSGAVAFFQEVMARKPEWMQVALVRLDAGFFWDSIMDKLERLGLLYIIVAKMNPRIRSHVGRVRQWYRLAAGIEVGEMTYQGLDWKFERRMIVVRQCIKERPQAQGRLFDDLPGYRYRILVTNTTMDAQKVWQLHRGRSDMENRIKELRHDFFMDSFSLKKFHATEAALWLVAIAYNLFSWFKLAILEDKSPRMMTVRMRLFLRGAVLGTENGRTVLRLSASPKLRATYDKLLQRLEKWKDPIAMHLALT